MKNRIFFACLIVSVSSLNLVYAQSESSDVSTTRTINGFEMVWCPPGEFLMGSPLGEWKRKEDETQRRVKISQGFWIGKYEVTQIQWFNVVGSNPSITKSKDSPVDNLTYAEIQSFLTKLNGVFSLPTEAQWEYACRAGKSGTDLKVEAEDIAFLDSAELNKKITKQIDDFAWYAGNSDGVVHPVGQKQPNSWGIHDMQGNVWEWCADRYGPYSPGPVVDPYGDIGQSDRVYRGGAFDSEVAHCRPALRMSGLLGMHHEGVGFRLVIAPGKSQIASKELAEKMSPPITKSESDKPMKTDDAIKIKIAELKGELSGVDKKIEAERKRWTDASDVINRLTNNRTRPVIRNSPEHERLYEAQLIMKEIEAKAPELNEQKARFEAALKALE